MNAIIFLLTIFFQSITYTGFSAHTPVKLAGGEYVAIQDVRIGDSVVCYDGDGGYTAREVLDIRSRENNCVCVVTDSTHIYYSA